jgi:XTP/dITP diphosphohydrolase
MAGKNHDERAAHFEASIAVAYDNKIIAEGTGRTFGSIAFEERGEHGFGYDPVFLLPDGRTMAELPPPLKNEISHRSKATNQIIPALGDLLDQFDPADGSAL